MTRTRTTSCVSLGALAMVLVGCTITPESLGGLSSFHVVVTSVNGNPPPSAESPLPANHGATNETWAFSIEARTATGDPAPFDGLVRLSVHPGAVLSIASPGAVGRNVLLHDGKASGIATLTAIYGPTSLEVEDVGYVPTPVGQTPQCANGIDDNGNGLVDYPNDPGCEFADDDTEGGGTFTSGISAPIQYALPKISDVQGDASQTPYPNEGMEINAAAPETLVVTRVSSSGFYVTDVAEQANGYNSLYAFNFSTPPDMSVCDRVTYLAGTVNEFFGMTELNFPSWDLTFVDTAANCIVPEPALLNPLTIATPVAMEKLEAGLVRIEGFSIANKFGPGLIENNVPTAGASNCDLNGNGAVDFSSPDEASCSAACDADVDCSEFTAFSARGDYKVHQNTTAILIETPTVPNFDPRGHRGEMLDAVTGTLQNFSGGTLHWTIQARCADDLVCQTAGCGAAKPVPATRACVTRRAQDDNDQGTN